MSCGKLIKRIVQPQDIPVGENAEGRQKAIFDSTYGISGDPLMLFAATFSALIHDVDHTGLTNAELNKMGVGIASLYREQSVAEQNSVDIAWALLMEDRFQILRDSIYVNQEEFHRFRQLVVNAVVATDIAGA